MTAIKRILITPGEPAGIGPDVLLQIIQSAHSHQLIAVADPELLLARAEVLNLPLRLIEVDLAAEPVPHVAGTLAVLPVKMRAAAIAGQLNVENAAYVIETLTVAGKLCLEKKAHGLVTGPVHKAVINDAGIKFSGHTEFFAALCGVPLTVMLFVVDTLKVALVTTHLPLQQVPAAITAQRLEQILAILIQGLKKQFDIDVPRVLVCGLNPHAGEDGHLGREEIEVIAPTLQRLQQQHPGIRGPLPADTIFTPQQLATADAVLAMYHDQALPLVKYLGFHHAVNMTLGLPFVRTSVDHGTALDIAGMGVADSGSLAAAVGLCGVLSCHPAA